ncbi:MAG: hypothetical protein FWG55_01565 [Candidatus Bathyarchaeota archaeon]|nr:hypothetical protein [Candidatus Termiticorpusculum sp.]
MNVSEEISEVQPVVKRLKDEIECLVKLHSKHVNRSVNSARLLEAVSQTVAKLDAEFVVSLKEQAWMVKEKELKNLFMGELV